jgi:CPA1 family monovalent cation:H+ antiporter
VTGVAIAVRFAWVFPVAYLPQRLSGKLRDSTPRQHKRELVIIGWCGMRGIVSLAAALALPLTLPGGAPFPYRDLIIFVTFVVIVATLVGPGPDADAADPTPPRRLALAAARRAGAGARRHEFGALAAIDETLATEGVPAQWAQALKAEIAERIALAASEGETSRRGWSW